MGRQGSLTTLCQRIVQTVSCGRSSSFEQGNHLIHGLGYMGAKRPELLNLIPKGILDWAYYPCSLYIDLFLFWLTESVQRHLAPDYTIIMSRTLKVTFDFPGQRCATLAILVSASATVPNGFLKDAIVGPALNSRAKFYGLGILDNDARLMGFWKMTILTLCVFFTQKIIFNSTLH